MTVFTNEVTVRTADPETSHESAGSTPRRVAIAVELLVVYANAAREGRGLTDEEAMVEANYDLADDGHRRRCSTLRDAKLIEQVEINGVKQKRVSTRTKKNRMVCTITHAGIDLLKSLGRL